MKAQVIHIYVVGSLTYTTVFCVFNIVPLAIGIFHMYESMSDSLSDIFKMTIRPHIGVQHDPWTNIP